jgi:hypothetical protein
VRLTRLILLTFGGLVLAFGNSSVLADPAELTQLFPDHVGTFRRSQTVNQLTSDGVAELSAETEYASVKGEKVNVQIARFHQDAEAYARLTAVAQMMREKQPSIAIGAQLGTAGVVASGQIVFVKGLNFVRIAEVNSGVNPQTLASLAQLLADRLDKGEGEIPALIKHLPKWEQAYENAVFINSAKNLEEIAPLQPVLHVISTEGDADAVVGAYGATRVLIIEFHTPQLAGDNDRSIVSTIQNLRNQGKPLPSGYRRVGNYSVFVFDAASEKAAGELIDQVKYEQVVQWLGENPNILKEAERRYVETTLGVFLTVIKASGVAALGSLAFGGLFGGLLFIRRRAQQRTVEAYSDAGGMLRLNIDELTPQTDPARLIRERN